MSTSMDDSHHPAGGVHSSSDNSTDFILHEYWLVPLNDEATSAHIDAYLKCLVLLTSRLEDQVDNYSLALARF